MESTSTSTSKASKQLDDPTRFLICRKYDQGKNQALIATELDLNRKTVDSVIRLYKTTGRISKIKQRECRKKKIDEKTKSFLCEQINEDVSVTLNALKNKLQMERGLSVCTSTINSAIKACNYSFKRIEMVPIARNAEKLIGTRQIYCENYMLLDESKLIFVDEFGISCSTRVKYGRSLVGTIYI